MPDLSGRDVQSVMQKSLGLMHSALELLDEAEAPANIGACLDLAICRLEEELGGRADHLGSDAPRR